MSTAGRTFFQTEVAKFWNGLGARFFALDLRKYGRSLCPGQTEGYVTSLEVYDDDVEAALSAMGTEAAGRRLVLLGHSTGGLTLTWWAARAAFILTFGFALRAMCQIWQTNVGYG